MKTKKALKKYQKGCIALATEFMKHKDDELGDDYVLGDLWCDYYIGAEHTDFWVFADWSEYYTWSKEDMYIALRDNIPYEVMTEHFEWWMSDAWLFSEYRKPEWWHNLEHYAKRRKENSEISAEDFQRMLEREYHEVRAKWLSDETKKETEEYERDAMEKFKKA